MARARHIPSPPPPATSTGRQRWLLLVHQLPPLPSNLRVRVWRRLQGLGAVAVKQAVYALPDTPESREDFEWIKVEIEGSGGEASVFAAEHLDPAAGMALVDEFRNARRLAYEQLAAEIQRLARRPASSAKARRQRGRPRDDMARFRQRLADIERQDFFHSDGRERVVTLLAALDGPPASSSAAGEALTSAGRAAAARHQRRLWVTRPRPGIDRMASAWLIRRFIDPHARFAFVAEVKAAPDAAVAFDMFGAGFGHLGDHCTFETLQARFGIRDSAVKRLSEIVHDLDLKDGRFGAPDAATVGAAVDGLQLSYADDGELLERGMTLFEALYRSFAQTDRAGKARRPVPGKPKRGVARRRPSS